MVPEELVALCDRFDDSADFAAVVNGALGLGGVQQSDLANEFEVAVSTISRWAAGSAKPRPRIQRFVVDRIKRLVKIE